MSDFFIIFVVDKETKDMVKQICNRLKLVISDWRIYFFNKKNGVEIISEKEYVEMLFNGKINKRIYIE